MRLTGGYTPKELAITIALDALKAAHEGETNIVTNFTKTPKQEAAVLSAIAKLHNSMLSKATELDAVYIGVDAVTA